MSSINDLQTDWIKEIRKNVTDSQNAHSIPFIKYPKDYSFGERPMLENFYLKPVVISVPHKQFPGLILKCKVCDAIFKPLGWPTNPVARYMHGLNYGSYILQYRYSCDCGSVDSSKVLQSLPSICSNLLPIEVITPKSAVDKDLMVYITSDATTGKFANFNNKTNYILNFIFR